MRPIGKSRLPPCVGALAAALAVPRVAAAQSTSEQMLAQSLFEEGRALMEARRYAEACPNFAESQRLDPGGGTLLNLAVCHEHEGRLGTAFTELTAARAQARREGQQERVDLADVHLAAIGERVPRLTLRVLRDEGGLQVLLDGVVLRQPAWNVPTIVDPGPHVIEARSPRSPLPFRLTLDLREGDRRVVDVAFPEAARSTWSGSGEHAAEASTRANPVRSVAVAVSIGAAILAGAATVGWGFSALRRDSECKEERSYCTASGLDALAQERAFGWTALASAGIAGVSLVITTILPRRVTVSAAPAPRGASLGVTAAF